MIDSVFLYTLNLINRTEFNAIAVGTTGKERKGLINCTRSFYYLVSFKLACTYCITKNIIKISEIKKIFEHFDCFEEYKVYIRLIKKYPQYMKNLKFNGKLPQSNEEVKEGFSKLYAKYQIYITKYARKKLCILKNSYRSWEDIESSFLATLLLSYYRIFLNTNKAYVENYFKLSIRNYGKLLFEEFSRKKRSEINNTLKRTETKIEECQISDALLAILKIEEIEDDYSELQNYIVNGKTIGARLCRILIGNHEPEFIEWLQIHDLTLDDIKHNLLFHAKAYFNINEPTWKQFIKDFRERYV